MAVKRRLDKRKAELSEQENHWIRGEDGSGFTRFHMLENLSTGAFRQRGQLAGGIAGLNFLSQCTNADQATTDAWFEKTNAAVAAQIETMRSAGNSEAEIRAFHNALMARLDHYVAGYCAGLSARLAS